MGVTVRYREKKGNKQSIFLDIFKDGKRKYEFLEDLFLYTNPSNNEEKQFNKLVREQIEKKVAERNYQLLSQKYDFTKAKKQSGDFLQLFKEEADKRYKKRGAKSNTYCCYKHLAKFSGGNIPYKHLTEEFANGFREHLLEYCKLSANCARTYYQRFKMIVIIAHKSGFIQIDPTLNVRPIKEVQPRREYLTIEEVKILKETPCKVDLIKRMFLFACYTGLRISDLKAIKWANVRGDRLIFNPVKTKNKVLAIPLNETAKFYMGEKGRPDEHIFKWYFEGDGNRYDLLREWIWLRAGIGRNITWHTARHTYATLLLGHTHNLKLVKEALGHSRIETTEIYARLMPEVLAEGVNGLDTI